MQEHVILSAGPMHETECDCGQWMPEVETCPLCSVKLVCECCGEVFNGDLVCKKCLEKMEAEE